MPSGHTERETINDRRPLTDNMLRVLRILRDRGFVHWHDLHPKSARNGLRALKDRGLVKVGDGMVPRWELTEAGHEVLKRPVP